MSVTERPGPDLTRLRERAVAVLREPFLHFVVLGLLIFAFNAWRGAIGDPSDRRIIVSQAEVQRLVGQWMQTWRRPPTPGEPRPQELQPESAARQAVLGQQAAIQRSEGEKLLTTRAGVSKSDPLIRYVVDDEFGEVAHKDKSFADKVLFWKKPAPDAIARAGAREAAIEASSPLDAGEEEARIKAALGTKPILIKRSPEGLTFKLPGL